MPTLADAIDLIERFSTDFRNPNLEPFEISKKYELFPKSNDESGTKCQWPNTYPNTDRQGVYLICGENLNLLYVGKASMNNSLGARLASYFAYDSDGKTCKVKHGDNWSQKPHFVITVAVPRESSFEAPALEEYLIGQFADSLPDNTIGAR